MKKAYNLSMLFEEEEFDVSKGYNRYGNKEEYFAVLNRFMTESEPLLESCKREGETEAAEIYREAEQLQKLLVDIGAINLAWNLQNISQHYTQKNNREYMRKLKEVVEEAESLRKRIKKAEKGTETEPRGTQKSSESKEEEIKERSIPRRRDFEKLLMLVDNFETESAEEVLSTIMSKRYTEEIDEKLEEVSRSLKALDFATALESARRLIVLVVAAGEARRASRKSILAIDDMPDILRTVKSMLRDKYNVYAMTNYESAVKFLRSKTADLILLDIEMPGLDGFAMMQLFRKIPDYAQTPVVFLSGNASDEHKRMALSLGAREFIKKPVDVNILISEIEKVLE